MRWGGCGGLIVVGLVVGWGGRGGLVVVLASLEDGADARLWWGVMSVGRMSIINVIKLSSMDVIHGKMVV